MSSVHVVFGGRNEALDFAEVFTAERLTAVGFPAGQEPSVSNLTESQVKTALSRYFDVGTEQFQPLYVELNSDTGNITVRPDAKFGQ